MEELLNGFTRNDLPFMQETGEYLEAQLNECVHDFAKNDLLFMEETGEYLEALLNEFIHDFAKNDLPFMEETMVSIPVLNFTSILPDQNVCGSTI